MIIVHKLRVVTIFVLLASTSLSTSRNKNMRQRHKTHVILLYICNLSEVKCSFKTMPFIPLLYVLCGLTETIVGNIKNNRKR